VNKTVFFRDDDVQDSDARFKEFLGLFLRHKVPVHLAVIPGNISARCGTFLRQCLKKYPGLVEIGQHGYKHVNYSQDAMNKYEFGPRRTYARQKKDMAKGKEILSKIIKGDLVFTPPWHGFDRNTVKALAELGFSGISLDRKSKMPENMDAVRSILTNVYFNKKDLKGWFVEDPDVILEEIKYAPGPKAGVQLHHNEFKSDRDFEVLDELLLRLKKVPGARFCRLSEGSSWNP